MIHRIEGHPKVTMIVVRLDRLAPFLGAARDEQTKGGSSVTSIAMKPHGSVNLPSPLSLAWSVALRELVVQYVDASELFSPLSSQNFKPIRGRERSKYAAGIAPRKFWKQCLRT